MKISKRQIAKNTTTFKNRALGKTYDTTVFELDFNVLLKYEYVKMFNLDGGLIATSEEKPKTKKEYLQIVFEMLSEYFESLETKEANLKLKEHEQPAKDLNGIARFPDMEEDYPFICSEIRKENDHYCEIRKGLNGLFNSFSNQEISNKAGIPKNHVASYRTGSRSLNIERAKLIASAMGYKMAVEINVYR